MVQISVSTPVGSEVKDTAVIADKIVDLAMDNVPELESAKSLAIITKVS